jgi:hypothetical protein
MGTAEVQEIGPRTAVGLYILIVRPIFSKRGDPIPVFSL